MRELLADNISLVQQLETMQDTYPINMVWDPHTLDYERLERSLHGCTVSCLCSCTVKGTPPWQFGLAGLR